MTKPLPIIVSTTIKTNGDMTREALEGIVQAVGRTRRERRDWRQFLQAACADDLAKERRQKAQDAKLKRRRCGAHARSRGKSCLAPALANGRCKLHGGLSTGAKTAEGRVSIAEAQRRRWARWRAARDAKGKPTQ